MHGVLTGGRLEPPKPDDTAHDSKTAAAATDDPVSAPAAATNGLVPTSATATTDVGRAPGRYRLRPELAGAVRRAPTAGRPATRAA